MVGLQDIQNKIALTKWSELQKQQILEMSASFGPNTLTYLEQRLVRSDFELIKEDLYISLFDCQEAIIYFVQNKNANYLIDLLHSAKNKSEYGYGEYLLPLLFDLERLVDRNKAPYNEEVIKLINEYEADFSQKLPPVEVSRIVEQNLVFFLDQLEIVNELKRLYFSSSFFGNEEFIKQLLFNLVHNKEIIGQEPIEMDKKSVKPQIQFWIQDLIISTPKNSTGSGISTFDEIQYMKTSPNVKKLSQKDQNRLLEIFKLYNWLLKPEVTFEEVESYDLEKYKINNIQPTKVAAPPRVPLSKIMAGAPTQTLRDIQYKKESIAEVGLNLKNVPTKTLGKQPPIVPAGPLKIQADRQRQIEEKLQNLRKKVSK